MDRPVQIAKDLSLHAIALKLTKDHVLLETNEREGMIGSMHVPIEALERYPTSGWVYAVGPDITEDLNVGDFVLVEEEGMAIGYSYYDVFEITIRHDDGLVETVYAEIEVEPVVREQVSKYRRGGEDTFLKMVDKKVGSSIGFNCSNVVSWQIGNIANPTQDLTYLPVFMLYIVNEHGDPALFYIAQEARILATVEY